MDKKVLGIDIAKATFDVVFLADDRSEYHQFSNSSRGFMSLIKWLKKLGADDVHACMEATGRYGEALSEFLFEKEFTVSVVNPARIKGYAQSQLRRNKTDKLDAKLIADFCLKQDPFPWSPPSEALKSLQQMVRHHESLQKMCLQEQNRLKSGISDLVVVSAIKSHIAFIKKQIDDLKRDIQNHLDDDPDLKQQKELLSSIPGIADLTAAKLLAEIRNIDAFDNVRQLVAFAGLNPKHFSSGSSVSGRAHISKTGSALLRQALYMSAVVAAQYNPVVKEFKTRLIERGKLNRVANVACMRKLLHIVYGVLKSGKPFDLNHGQIRPVLA